MPMQLIYLVSKTEILFKNNRSMSGSTCRMLHVHAMLFVCTILLHYHTEAKEKFYKILNLKGIVCYKSHYLKQPSDMQDHTRYFLKVLGNAISKLYYHSFGEPNVWLARLQMELCRAANIFAAC